MFYYDGTITLSIRLLALHNTVTTALAKSVSVPVSWVMQRHSGIMRKDKVYDDKQNDINWFLEYSENQLGGNFTMKKAIKLFFKEL